MKILALLALLTASPSLAQPARVSPASATAALQAKSARLAKLYFAEAKGRAVGAREFRKNFLAGINAQPAALEAEKKHPGIINAGLQAGLVRLDKAYDELMPRLNLRLAGFFAERFSNAELDQAIAFYASPTGQKALSLTAERTDTSALSKRLAEDPKVGISSDDLLKLLGPNLVSELSDADRRVFHAFMVSPAGKKFGVHAQPLLELVSTEMTASMQQMLPEIQKSVLTAFQTYPSKQR